MYLLKKLEEMFERISVEAIIISQVLLVIIVMCWQVQTVASITQKPITVVEEEVVVGVKPLELPNVAAPHETESSGAVEETKITDKEEETIEMATEVETTEIAEVNETLEQEVQKKQEIELLREFYNSLNTSTDMSQNLGISKERFVEILTVLPYDYVDVFETNAETLWETPKKYDFNEFLIVGIMAQEALWGKKPAKKNNYFGLKVPGSNSYQPFDTFEEGAEILARNLANNYLAEDGKNFNGKSLDGIGKKYCEGNTWSGKVRSCIKMVLREYFKTID